MAAFPKPVVVNKFGISFLGPAPWGLVDLIRKGAYSNRDLDAPDIEEAGSVRDPRRVPVEPRRGDGGICEPVERDVVENIVSRKAFGLSVEDASDHQVTADVMIDHPRGEAYRRISDAVQSLWAVRHLLGVGKAVRVEIVKLVPRMFFIG